MARNPSKVNPALALRHTKCIEVLLVSADDKRGHEIHRETISEELTLVHHMTYFFSVPGASCLSIICRVPLVSS